MSENNQKMAPHLEAGEKNGGILWSVNRCKSGGKGRGRSYRLAHI